MRNIALLGFGANAADGFCGAAQADLVDIVHTPRQVVRVKGWADDACQSCIASGSVEAERPRDFRTSQRPLPNVACQGTVAIEASAP